MDSPKETLIIEKEPHLRNVSYSSYVNPTSDIHLRELVGTRKIPNSVITVHKQTDYDVEKKVEDGEIDVFGAEKYFNGEIDEETINQKRVKSQNLDLGTTIQTRLPSVHSQSSWNSHRALLQSGRRSQIHNKNAKWRQGKSFLSTLTSICACCDNNPIDVEENKSEIFSKRSLREEVDLDQTKKTLINPLIKEMQMKKAEDFKTELKTEECFTFPIMNPKPENFPKKHFFHEDRDEKVINFPVFAKRKESLEKKQDLFTLDINSKRDEIDYQPSSNGIFDGFESDSSSDLFEITSFSTTNNSNPYLLRQASNVSSCVTPGYAPSEASIEWSVVTASAIDFSFAPDSDYPSKKTRNGKGKEVEKRRMGIFSGCRNQKAVTVAEEAYKTHGKVVPDTRRGHIFRHNQVLRIDTKTGRNSGSPGSLLRSNSGRT